MYQRFILSIFFTVFFTMGAKAQMTITVVSTPQLTPILDDIYIAGSFNEWNPADPQYKLHFTDGVWHIDIPGNENENIEFKFTRGSWATVEGNAEGTYIVNRLATWINGSIAEFSIADWEDIAGLHTVNENVRILDSDMEIPQLGRTRRIWIKLPAGYYNSEEYYPVLYMHDGQNLFDAATSFAGEWTIDEIADELIETTCSKAIIVGIENGGAHRIDEYAPWYNNNYEEGGEGSPYGEFVVQQLKPLIETQFRARTEREYNFTGGSSLGGLIATYLVLAHQDDFGGAIVFSPSYWFNPEIQDLALNAGINSDTKIYFACGQDESETMVSDMQQMINNLESSGVPSSNINSHIQSEGEHSEYWWAQYFEAAYEFCFGCATHLGDRHHDQGMMIFPNPVKEKLNIQYKGRGPFTMTIYDHSGKSVMQEKWIPGQTIQVNQLPHGVYTVELIQKGDHHQEEIKHTQKMIKY